MNELSAFDEALLVVIDIDDDVQELLHIACDDPRFAEYLKGDAE